MGDNLPNDCAHIFTRRTIHFVLLRVHIFGNSTSHNLACILAKTERRLNRYTRKTDVIIQSQVLSSISEN